MNTSEAICSTLKGGAAGLVGSGDIKGDFVRALLIIAAGDLDWVTGVSDAYKLNALFYNAASIETRQGMMRLATS